MKMFLLAMLLCLNAFAQPTLYQQPDEGVDTMNGMKLQADQLDVHINDSLNSMVGLNDGYCVANKDDFFSFIFPSAVALMIIAFGIAIFYMFGNLFQSPQMVAMAKQEILEFVHTAIIVIFFFFFLFFTDNVLFAGQEPIYDQAISYSVAMLHKITKDVFWLSAINTLLYMIYSAPLRMGGVLHHAVHFNLGGVLKPFVDGVGTFASLLSFAMGEWIANLSLLCFIRKYLPLIFLPIGILLKAFPQTRGGGNAIISLSIAFFLVYPLMLTMNYEAYKYRYGVVGDRGSIQEITEDFLLGSGIFYASIYILFAKAFTGTFMGIAFLSQLVTLAIDIYADVLYTVFVLSIFLPLLNIFVTLTFAREIAKYFGTEINISAFVKLI